MSQALSSDPKESQSAVASVRALLDRRVRISLKDGRLVEGVLECFDASRNLVLRDSVDITTVAGVASRHPCGLVLVPGGSYTSVFAEKKKEPKLPLATLSLETGIDPLP